MINFKKVVSMVVMLSLMLGACGKSPARRDGDSNAEIVSLEKLDISTKGEKRGQYFSELFPASDPMLGLTG